MCELYTNIPFDKNNVKYQSSDDFIYSYKPQDMRFLFACKNEIFNLYFHILSKSL